MDEVHAKPDNEWNLGKKRGEQLLVFIFLSTVVFAGLQLDQLPQSQGHWTFGGEPHSGCNRVCYFSSICKIKCPWNVIVGNSKTIFCYTWEVKVSHFPTCL